jgi:hypothetical protein
MAAMIAANFAAIHQPTIGHWNETSCAEHIDAKRVPAAHFLENLAC